jgi:hypothetical protein
MILDQDKIDCIESISQSLERSAAWRRTLVEKFPADKRNEKAAAALDRLALAAATLTDEQWQEIKPRFEGWASHTWRSDISQAARQVGFGHRSNSFDSFLKLLIGPSHAGVAA